MHLLKTGAHDLETKCYSCSTSVSKCALNCIFVISLPLSTRKKQNCAASQYLARILDNPVHPQLQKLKDHIDNIWNQTSQEWIFSGPAILSFYELLSQVQLVARAEMVVEEAFLPYWIKIHEWHLAQLIQEAFHNETLIQKRILLLWSERCLIQKGNLISNRFLPDGSNLLLWSGSWPIHNATWIHKRILRCCWLI